MKSNIVILVFLTLVLACNDGKYKEKDVVTKKILYDVTIINKDKEFDWWVQNIEGENREELISNILNSVASGNVTAYDYLSHKAMSKHEISQMLKRTDTIAIESPNPPYDLMDTIINSELKKKDIEKLRFLEEWYMNDNSLSFQKKIVGICPMIAKYGDTGDFRGYMPLFWVFFDEKYPAALK